MPTLLSFCPEAHSDPSSSSPDSQSNEEKEEAVAASCCPLDLALSCLKPVTTNYSVITHRACPVPGHILGAVDTGASDTSGVVGREMKTAGAGTAGLRGLQVTPKDGTAGKFSGRGDPCAD